VHVNRGLTRDRIADCICQNPTLAVLLGTESSVSNSNFPTFLLGLVFCLHSLHRISPSPGLFHCPFILPRCHPDANRSLLVRPSLHFLIWFFAPLYTPVTVSSSTILVWRGYSNCTWLPAATVSRNPVRFRDLTHPFKCNAPMAIKVLPMGAFFHLIPGRILTSHGRTQFTSFRPRDKRLPLPRRACFQGPHLRSCYRPSAELALDHLPSIFQGRPALRKILGTRPGNRPYPLSIHSGTLVNRHLSGCKT
jgi:hypothetical protein